MKIKAVLFILILGFATQAFAGKIYGSITEGGKPVSQGTKLEVACGSNNYSAQTDANAAFNLFAAHTGNCLLQVLHHGQMLSIEISSYDGSVQYDLVLEKQGTQYTLKRK